MASLIYQVVDTLKKNTVDMMNEDRIKAEKIPTKNYDAQQQELKSDKKGKWNHLIFSYKTYETYRDRAIVFAKYVKKEFGVKKLNEITTEMTKSFFEERINKNSAWTLHGDRAALVKLENCMIERNWLSKESRFVLSSKELNIPDRKLENRQKKGLYTDLELDSIEKNVSESVSKYVKFVRNTGSRIKGASTIKVKDLNFEDGNLILTEKGGYSRTIAISDDFQDWLKNLVKNKDSEDKVLPEMTDRNVTQQIKEVCKEQNIQTSGIHRVRATFARNMYNELRNRGYDSDKAKKTVSKHLGHHRMRVIRYYMN